MQNQNQFLESMLVELLDEAKKISNDKKLPISAEEGRSNQTLKKEIKKLLIESNDIKKLRNKKIKTKQDRSQKKLECLTILEKNVSEIENLSKHVESLSLKKQKYKEEITRLRYSLTKKDETIKNLKATIDKTSSINSGTKSVAYNNADLREQLEKCKKQHYKKEKSYIQQIEDFKQEMLKYKQLYEELKSEKASPEMKQNCFHRSDEPVEVHKLTQRLKCLEKELEASSLELAEYEEENKCYCQKIETLLKTITCLQEAKLRSEEDSAEYCERINKLRTEFQEVCEQKNKDIDELNKQLQVMKNHDEETVDLINHKDDEIKSLQDRIVQLEEEMEKYVLMERQYKECQLEYDTYMKHLNASQKLLAETYSKLDSCDRIINDLKYRNSALEGKIGELQRSLDEKINGIASSEFKIKELQCTNLKLNKELNAKESVIRSLESCLERSNKILETCEKEMNIVEERNQMFTNEMCQLKSRLEGEIIHNQHLSIQYKSVNKDDDLKSSDENSDSEIANLQNTYDDLLTKAAARENDIEYIKSQIIKCFGKEVCQYTPTSGNELCEVENKLTNRAKQIGKRLSHKNENNFLKRPQSRRGSRMEHQKCKSRSRSPNMSLYYRAQTCPGQKVTLKFIVRSFSAPGYCRYGEISTERESAIDLLNPFTINASKSDEDFIEKFNFSRNTRGFTQYNKPQHSELRGAKSDSSLEDNLAKPTEAASSTPSTRSTCTCMSVITRRYGQDRSNRKYCGYR